MRFTSKSAKILGVSAILLLSTGVASAYRAVATTDLKVRTGQGTGYRVIGVLPRGSVVDVTGCGDGWCYVRNYGGYASARYLDSGYASTAPGIRYYRYPWPYSHRWRWGHRYYDWRY